MIVTRQDVDDFIDAYSDFQTDYEFLDEDQEVIDYVPFFEFMRWLNEHPQAIIASNFNEYLAFGTKKFFPNSTILDEAPQPFFRSMKGQWSLPALIEDDPTHAWRGYSMGQMREMELRAADETEDAIEAILDGPEVPYPSANEIIRNLESLCDSPQIDPTLFVSPRLWTPSQQRLEIDALRDSTVPIIRELQNGKLNLATLSWRQLEEIVAELLRARGMEIHVVKENPQGGRDIIARGELVPGAELVTIAIEVKHRTYVDRPEVQKAIHQNRMFPALMFVTSGSFSAGVVREAAQAENRMRLFLKDGVAVRDLVKMYKL